MRTPNTILSRTRMTVVLILCAASVGLRPARAQATFRVLTYMYQYDQPEGILEGSPGLFYSESGSATPVALTVTASGTKAILASIPPGHILPGALVSAANGRFYSSATYQLNPARVFSVAATAGSIQFYSPQSLDPILTENLPDSSILGVAAGISSHLWGLVTVGLDGIVTSVYQFPSTDLPVNAVYATDGNYYGISQMTNASTGYIFRATPSGSFTKIYNFPTATFTGPLPSRSFRPATETFMARPQPVAPTVRERSTS